MRQQVALAEVAENARINVEKVAKPKPFCCHSVKMGAGGSTVRIVVDGAWAVDRMGQKNLLRTLTAKKEALEKALKECEGVQSGGLFWQAGRHARVAKQIKVITAKIKSLETRLATCRSRKGGSRNTMRRNLKERRTRKA